MLQLLTCSRGHAWEAAAADGATAVGRAVCPVCGDVVDVLPLLDLAPSAEAITAVPDPVLPQAPPLRDAAGKPVVAGFDLQEDLGRTPAGVRQFRAKQLLVNRPVLLKVVVARDDAGQAGWGSLRGEAAALGRLHHPNIVAILEAGERERQLFYNAVEWVEGPTLAEHAAGRPMPRVQAARLVEVLARAVHAAHQQGVVHRGLRPSCVRLQPQPGAGDGKRKEAAVGPPYWQAGAACVLPRVADFGLARRPVEGDAADLELHDGPPAYLAPEQAWGRAREIGPASDVYALGAILYELLAGRPPYGGRTPGETLDFIRAGDPPWLRRVNPRLPPDVAAVCRKAMHRRPTNRYKSALDLAEDLRAFAEGRPVQARVAGAAERFGKWARRRPAAALLLLACVLAAAGILTAYLIGAGDGAADQRLAEAVLLRASAAESREAGLRHDLEEARKREQATSYYHRILLADRAVAEGRANQARQLLDTCPTELRHWEWHYLNDRVSNPGREVLTLTGPEPAVKRMAFSPNGDQLAAASDDESNSEVRVWAPPDHWAGQGLTGMRGSVTQLAYSPDGQRLATAADVPDNALVGGFGELKEWDPVQRRELSTRRIRHGLLMDMAYCPDGKRLIAVEQEGHVCAFLVGSLAESDINIVTAGSNWTPRLPRLAVLNADGSKLAVTSCTDFHVVISGSPIYAAQHTDEILALTFNAETGLLASASRDETAQVWDVQSNRLVSILRGHAAAVTSISFTRDGRRLATASEDGDVRIWDPLSGQEVLRLAPFEKDMVGDNHRIIVQFRPGKDDWQLAIAHQNQIRLLGPQRPL